MNLALFDLDNTLLSGDSDYEWAQYLIAVGALDRATHEVRNQDFYAQYLAGTLDIDAFLAFQLHPLTRFPRAQLEAWRHDFVSRKIRPLISDAARALVQGHRAAGDLCAIVTATNSFITGLIPEEFSISHLIATIPAWEHGAFTGKARGTPAFRDGKISRVSDWLESLGFCWEQFTHTWFYSDSHNDLPLLNQVKHPIAVDPDARLRQHAETCGWPIISLRKPVA